MDDYNKYIENGIQRRKLIKALARRGEFPEWKSAYQAIEEVIEGFAPSKTSACAASALSMLAAANNPHHVFYGNVPYVWNEGENE